MRRRLVLALSLIAALALLPAPGAQADNAVTDWNAITQGPLTTGRPPGDAQVMIGIVQVAVFDAVDAIEGGFTPYAGRVRARRGASPVAAVAAAAHRVATTLVPAQEATLDADYAAYLAGLPDGRRTRAGIAVGEAAAANVLAVRRNDGLDDTTPFVPPAPGPGVWQLTLPSPAVDPNLGRVRPLALASPSQFRPAGPLPLTSRRYARDLAEVEALGRVDSPGAHRRADRNRAVLVRQHHRDMERRAARAGRRARSGLARSARMFAVTDVSAADTVIACFDAKYHYLAWRPVTAIQNADTDGNPRTEADPSWTALLNVNHPEYPSGHGCLSGAVAASLTNFFGTDAVPVTLSSAVTNTSRSFARLSDAVEDAGNARVWAGLHFRHSVLDGNRLGENVAGYVAARLFRPSRGRGHESGTTSD